MRQGRDKAELVMDLAKRRGFFWPSFEIYGGVSGFITYGPLGTALKERIINLWREIFVKRHDFVEIDSPIILPYVVLEASGHVKSFKDKMATCSSCGRKFRADHLLEEAGFSGAEILSLEETKAKIEELGVKCPSCGGPIDDVTYFTTMFQTTIGPYSDAIGFGRPETAQGMFLDFKHVYMIERRKFPLGIAQVGRGLRNEISPRQGPIRLREFTMMEIELFYDPADPSCPYFDDVADVEMRILHAKLLESGIKEPETMTAREAVERKVILAEWLAYFMALSQLFVTKLGVSPERQMFREKLPGERAHYARQTFDHEVLLERWGWVEVAGHADRTDYDLKAHMAKSGADLFVPRLGRITEYPVVLPNKDAIAEDFGEHAQKIIGCLRVANPRLVEKELKERGFVEVAGFKLTTKHVKVKYEKGAEKFIPWVAEPSFGVDRLVYATLENAYTIKDDRVVLKLPPPLAPITAGVLPLVAREEMVKKARAIYARLQAKGLSVIYDEKGSIGRRYARLDEVGVPVAFTVDGQTLEDGTVTARDRDTWKQVRIKEANIPNLLRKLLAWESFDKAVARYVVSD